MHDASPPDRSIAAYSDVTDRDRLERLHALGEALEDYRIAHINSTDTGGGVAELLQSIVPLSNDLGVDTDWLVMDAEDAFFEVTKTIHNGLHGEGPALTDDMKTAYRRVTERNAAAIDDEYDLVVLHDPQTLGMVDTLTETMPEATMVWRCHIDLSEPSPEHLAFIGGYTDAIDHAIVSRTAFGAELDVPSTSTVYPSIDPLTEKNRELDETTVANERERLDPLSLDAPLVTHISRFDPWKDQTGTLEAYRQVSETVPELQLALVGSMADDDPEGQAVYEEVAAAAGDDPDVHLLTGVPDTTVNVLQRRSDVVAQKSFREGFGLVVAEALWKETPVVGSTVGGIPLQIEDSQNGYLVEPDDVDGLAARIEDLLTDDAKRAEFGRNAREHVRNEFLLPRQLEDWLEVFAEHLGEDTG